MGSVVFPAFVLTWQRIKEICNIHQISSWKEGYLKPRNLSFITPWWHSSSLILKLRFSDFVFLFCCPTKSHHRRQGQPWEISSSLLQSWLALPYSPNSGRHSSAGMWPGFDCFLTGYRQREQYESRGHLLDPDTSSFLTPCLQFHHYDQQSTWKFTFLLLFLAFQFW